jgi:hypothetical protein
MTSAKDSARNQLAKAVADEISQILKRGDGVWREGEPWIPDTLRRRAISSSWCASAAALFEEIIRQLKLKGVPVAGADRMSLPDQLVVEDLISLARFALLPEDDLSLAEVLKSPFFHPVSAQTPPIDDDALFDLSRRPDGACGRSCAIAMMRASPKHRPRWTGCAAASTQWRPTPSSPPSSMKPATPAKPAWPGSMPGWASRRAIRPRNSSPARWSMSATARRR